MSPVITQDHTLLSVPFYPTGASKQLCFALCKRPLNARSDIHQHLSLFAIISGSPECSRRNMGYNSQPSPPCQLLRLTCDLHLNSNSITTCSYLAACNYSLKRNSETLCSHHSSHSLLLIACTLASQRRSVSLAPSMIYKWIWLFSHLLPFPSYNTCAEQVH